MVELKKDSLRQPQSGDWKVGFTIQANDMPDYLLTSPMGKRFYVVFVDADDYDEREGIEPKRNSNGTQTELSEGEKLRTRAVLLCKDYLFQVFVAKDMGYTVKEMMFNAPAICRTYIVDSCAISSRSELATNPRAQESFKMLLERYKTWQLENNYKDNLGRI